jgi:hypothetical protein
MFDKFVDSSTVFEEVRRLRSVLSPSSSADKLWVFGLQLCEMEAAKQALQHLVEHAKGDAGIIARLEGLTTTYKAMSELAALALHEVVCGEQAAPQRLIDLAQLGADTYHQSMRFLGFEPEKLS